MSPAVLAPVFGTDPAVLRRVELAGRPHRPDQGAGGLRRADGLGHADDLVRAQGDLGHAEPHRPQPGRAVRHRPDPGRRHQAVLQGGPDPRQGGQVRLQAGAVPDHHPGLPGLRHRAHRRRGHHRRPHVRVAAGRSGHGHPVPAGHVGHRRLRRDAGRVGVGFQVPAARLGAGLGPDDLLRGGPRHDRGHGGPGHRLAQHPGHRERPGPAPLAVERHPPRLHTRS